MGVKQPQHILSHAHKLLYSASHTYKIRIFLALRKTTGLEHCRTLT